VGGGISQKNTIKELQNTYRVEYIFCSKVCEEIYGVVRRI
jgi:hypothetical protein